MIRTSITDNASRFARAELSLVPAMCPISGGRSISIQKALSSRKVLADCGRVTRVSLDTSSSREDTALGQRPREVGGGKGKLIRKH